MRPSLRHTETSRTGSLSEAVRQFGAVVIGTALLVFMTAFVTVPYALERHPGEAASADTLLDSRHLS